MKRIYRLLSLSDTPVALAILLGAMAWLTTGVVTRQLEEPILEYSQKWLKGNAPETAVEGWRPLMLDCLIGDHKSNDSRLLLVTLKNLSRIVRLEGVMISVSMESEGSLLRMADRAIAPGVAGNDDPVCDEINGAIGPFALHPGGRHQFIVEIYGKTPPVFRLVQSKSAVNLVRSNTRTSLVKNYTMLATFTAFLFLILVVAYLIALDRAKAMRRSEEVSTK